MSKKKYKQSIYGTTNKTTKISVEYCPKTDSITINDIQGNTIKTVLSYDRDSGKEKVVTTIYGNGKEQLFDVNMQLLNYDIILAIDTNSFNINDTKYSISVAAISVPEKDNSEDGLQINYFCSFCFKNKNKTDNPELIGWYILLEKLFKNDENKKIVLITDSDLGIHNMINEHNMNYIGEHSLPKNIKIAYGSSDVGKSRSIANNMICLCDQNGENIAKEVKKNIETLDYFYEDNYIFGFCVFDPIGTSKSSLIKDI